LPGLPYTAQLGGAKARACLWHELEAGEERRLEAAFAWGWHEAEALPERALPLMQGS